MLLRWQYFFLFFWKVKKKIVYFKVSNIRDNELQGCEGARIQFFESVFG